MDLENPTDRKVGLWFERERAEGGGAFFEASVVRQIILFEKMCQMK